jgi:hypothetical protein
MKYILVSDPQVSEKNNLFMLSVFMREELPKNKYYNLFLPEKIYSKLSQKELNHYLSDLLLDADITDANIKIKIKKTDNFEIETN